MNIYIYAYIYIYIYIYIHTHIYRNPQSTTATIDFRESIYNSYLLPIQIQQKNQVDKSK